MPKLSQLSSPLKLLTLESSSSQWSTSSLSQALHLKLSSSPLPTLLFQALSKL
eukprot:c11400_g2_i1 orf=233-391(+)